MMAKTSLALLILFVAAITAQNYQYIAVLDDEGAFVLRWNVRPEQKDLEMKFDVKTKGWISLLIASEDGSYADVIFGGYNDDTKKGYLGDYHFNLTLTGGHLGPEEDASMDLILQESTYTESTGVTTLIIKRAQDTGDRRDDVPFRTGPLSLGWSYHQTSDSPDDPHTNAGFITLTLVPAVQ